MLDKLGVTIPAGINPGIKNVAAVSLHAELPAFGKMGQKIDVTISSLGNAKSLRGGTLLLAPLKGMDGKIYAVAQGNLVVGGLSASGEDGSKITVNLPVVGRIPNGAMIEVEVPSPFQCAQSLTFNLNRSDFSTSKALSDVINKYMGPQTATALDATSVLVNLPEEQHKKVMFISALENLNVEVGIPIAKVVVNSRTGTIIIGQNVVVGPAAITHGSLTVTITENKDVSQPQPLSLGVTTETNKSDVIVTQDKSRMFLLQPSVSLESIVRAVNQIGVAPGDLVAILEALKQAGALKAELEVI
jgi:flagellar P-ring protein precursor FlgI